VKVESWVHSTMHNVQLRVHQGADGQGWLESLDTCAESLFRYGDDLSAPHSCFPDLQTGNSTALLNYPLKTHKLLTVVVELIKFINTIFVILLKKIFFSLHNILYFNYHGQWPSRGRLQVINKINLSHPINQRSF
jgi:hypothetical protein